LLPVAAEDEAEAALKYAVGTRTALTEPKDATLLVQAVVVVHSFQVETVEPLGQEPLPEDKQDRSGKVDKVALGARHQVVVVVVDIMVAVAVETTDAVPAETAVAVVAVAHLLYLQGEVALLQTTPTMVMSPLLLSAEVQWLPLPTTDLFVLEGPYNWVLQLWEPTLGQDPMDLRQIYKTRPFQM
jgi:hypothetical protein